MARYFEGAMNKRGENKRLAGRVGKVLKQLALGLLVLIAVALAALSVRAELRLGRRYDPPVSPVRTNRQALARGEHLTRTYGCRHCHGEDLGGSVIEDSAAMYMSAPNLTPASRVVASFKAEDWARVLLNGVAPDGRPLLLMPSHHLRVLSDDDVAALASYLAESPKVQRELPRAELRFLGKLLLGSGADLLAAEQIDQNKPRAPVKMEPVGATLEYGAYLARACAGCHGQGLNGGPPLGPPGTPAPPAISPMVMKHWTKQQFVQAIREGKKRDGSQLDEMMPWRAIRHLTDEELDALWLALNH